ncbi:hypothetical protein OS493_012441 [Desmophyllum pertusum]|uniref:Uncharacterized protein n=1 Tax=Desmophyllum pertusum TaxID=174260 RepID=A0A9X0D560_9CNID|nr:hypothetical protein OS493_012441 [Desmophyllum pertusum]
MSDPDEDECAKPSPSKMSLSSEELQRVSSTSSKTMLQGAFCEKDACEGLDAAGSEESPSERTANYVYAAPSTSGGFSKESGRVEWSEEESALIEKALSGFDKCPRNPRSSPSSTPLRNLRPSTMRRHSNGYATK